MAFIFCAWIWMTMTIETKIYIKKLSNHNTIFYAGYKECTRYRYTYINNVIANAGRYVLLFCYYNIDFYLENDLNKCYFTSQCPYH